MAHGQISHSPGVVYAAYKCSTTLPLGACQQHYECRQYLRSLWWAAGSWHLHLLSRHLLLQHSLL